MDLDLVLTQMRDIYAENPRRAVRSQTFIRPLHDGIAEDLEALLTPYAVRRNITVVKEATIFGSHKLKDVDVSVIDPENGPLIMVGVRSQMSSVAKNALTYYESIIGECISLQDRFPMAVTGYVYLMPLHPIIVGHEQEAINHARYGRMYDAITGRTGQTYRDVRGVYDQFAYMVVDFNQAPPTLRNDLVAGLPHDLTLGTFVHRMVNTFNQRHIFLDVFRQ